jgi:hypothetical protein
MVLSDKFMQQPSGIMEYWSIGILGYKFGFDLFYKLL